MLAHPHNCLSVYTKLAEYALLLDAPRAESNAKASEIKQIHDLIH